MPLKSFISFVLLFTALVNCHAQLEEGRISLEPDDSLKYTDYILQHIFSPDPTEAIPAAEELYLIAKKYDSKIEMFHASCVLAVHYDVLLNDAKYTLWYARAGVLLGQIDDSDRDIYQAMYDQLSPAANGETHNNESASTNGLQHYLTICDQYIDLLHKKHGNCSLALYEAFNYKALFLYMLQRYSDALQVYFSAFDIQKELIANIFPYLTEDERYYYWQRNFSGNINFMAFAFQQSLFLQDNLLTKAYDQQLLTKGVLLSTSMSLHRSFSRNPALWNKWFEIGNIKKQMLATDTTDVLQLDIKANELERQLNQSIHPQTLTSQQPLTSQDVFNALGSDDIAIEVIEIQLYGHRTYYAFLTIDKQHPAPRLMTLISTEKLQQLLTSDYTQNSDLYKAIWHDIVKDSDHVKNIYFAPSGIFQTIPVEHCMTDNGMHMSERYNMYRVTSTREIVIPTPHSSNKRAVIYGAIDNISLPQTSIEIDNIRKIIKTSYHPIVRKGSQATKASLQELSGQSPHILHIATHGFYRPPKDTEPQNLITRYEDRLLTHSGLYFHAPAQSGADDVCTAAEISQLDLSTTRLVVLSACNTGLGQIEADGIFGLQRGFKKAGASSMLMSLWPVNDKATMLLMTEFYRNLSAQKTAAESLRQAQRYVRQYNNGYYSHKDNWAGFILIDALPH